MRGYAVRKTMDNEISMFKMNNCFEYFQKMQKDIEAKAHQVIVYHMRKWVKRRKEEMK